MISLGIQLTPIIEDKNPNIVYLIKDRYQGKFTSAFNSDKRVLTKYDIPLKKLIMVANILDMKLTSIVEDKNLNLNVSNIINDKVIVKFTSKMEE